MRLNTEKERISNFKEIVTDAVSLYYAVVEQFSKMLNVTKSEVIVRNEQEQDPSKIMQSGLVEA